VANTNSRTITQTGAAGGSIGAADRSDVGPHLQRRRAVTALQIRAGRAAARVQAAPEIPGRKHCSNPRPQAPRVALPDPPLQFKVGIAPARAAARFASADDVHGVRRTNNQIDGTGGAETHLPSQL